jgi:hypothetical protein
LPLLEAAARFGMLLVVIAKKWLDGSGLGPKACGLKLRPEMQACSLGLSYEGYGICQRDLVATPNLMFLASAIKGLLRPQFL